MSERKVQLLDGSEFIYNFLGFGIQQITPMEFTSWYETVLILEDDGGRIHIVRLHEAKFLKEEKKCKP